MTAFLRMRKLKYFWVEQPAPSSESAAGQGCVEVCQALTPGAVPAPCCFPRHPAALCSIHTDDTTLSHCPGRDFCPGRHNLPWHNHYPLLTVHVPQERLDTTCCWHSTLPSAPGYLQRHDVGIGAILVDLVHCALQSDRLLRQIFQVLGALFGLFMVLTELMGNGKEKGSPPQVRTGPNPGHTPGCCQLSIPTGTQ